VSISNTKEYKVRISIDDLIACNGWDGFINLVCGEPLQNITYEVTGHSIGYVTLHDTIEFKVSGYKEEV